MQAVHVVLEALGVRAGAGLPALSSVPTERDCSQAKAKTSAEEDGASFGLRHVRRLSFRHGDLNSIVVEIFVGEQSVFAFGQPSAQPAARACATWPLLMVALVHTTCSSKCRSRHVIALLARLSS